MKNGNLVAFNKVPGLNTPGVPSTSQTCIGTVIREDYPDGRHGMFKGSLWCDVLWPSGEVTKCFKKDLVSVDKSIDNFECNLF